MTSESRTNQSQSGKFGKPPTAAARAGLKAALALAAFLAIGQIAAAQEAKQPDQEPWKKDPIVKSDPWEKYQPVAVAPEKLGSGPYTLVISDGQAITRFDYSTGQKCQKARDAVRRQNAPPPDTPGVIHGPSRIQAYCVPR